MGYVHFSTDNADYVLVYAAHIKDAKDDVFNDGNMESLDAIVLENTGHDPSAMGSSQYGLSFLPPVYGTILKQSHKHSRKIYLVDAGASLFGFAAGVVMASVPLYLGLNALSQSKEDIRQSYEHEKPDRREFLKGVCKGLFGMWLLNGYSGFLFGALSKGETPNVLESAAASVHRIPPNPLVEGRNCVAARKIEEFVAPLVRENNEKRPRIAIVFGGGHSGMKECLQGKAWRDSVLKAYKEANYLGLDIYTLPYVWEMWPSDLGYGDCKLLGQDWFTARYNCELF